MNVHHTISMLDLISSAWFHNEFRLVAMYTNLSQFLQSTASSVFCLSLLDLTIHSYAICDGRIIMLLKMQINLFTTFLPIPYQRRHL